MAFDLVHQVANERIAEIYRIKAEINLAAEARAAAQSKMPVSEQPHGLSFISGFLQRMVSIKQKWHLPHRHVSKLYEA